MLQLLLANFKLHRLCTVSMHFKSYQSHNILTSFDRIYCSPWSIIFIEKHIKYIIEYCGMFMSFRLACLPDLQTLQITHNQLETAEDLEHLTECHNISCLDLSHNRIDDVNVLDVFKRMKSLVSLSLSFLCQLFVAIHLSPRRLEPSDHALRGMVWSNCKFLLHRSCIGIYSGKRHNYGKLFNVC